MGWGEGPSPCSFGTEGCNEFSIDFKDQSREMVELMRNSEDGGGGQGPPGGLDAPGGGGGGRSGSMLAQK